jgi:hypothetical protein
VLQVQGAGVSERLEVALSALEPERHRAQVLHRRADELAEKNKALEEVSEGPKGGDRGGVDKRGVSWLDLLVAVGSGGGRWAC